MKVNCFTSASDRLENQLLTPIFISEPFMPADGVEHPKLHKFTALWDTGATNTVVSKNVVDAVGIKPSGQGFSHHANGVSEVNIYLANIFLPNTIAIPFLNVSEGILAGFDVLIGMDIISRGDFAVSHFQGKTTFSFRMPSIGKIDFLDNENMADKNLSQPQVLANSLGGRNSPCSCGSGKKSKRCCGEGK